MPRRSDPIGQVINERYELLDSIGRGGQGIVYRAFDRWLGRPVAIKVLSSAAARHPHTAERLIREQQALSALKGTAAVEVLDICRGNAGELCLVMELLRGISLDDYLFPLHQRGERLELSRIVEIFDPVVDTLEVAHDAGILHRDLKPANVFLLEDGTVRLLDFGFARLQSAAPLTAAGTIMGSPSFMAPEAWLGLSSEVDRRADVYSLGVMLFFVLAGALPFPGESLREKFLGSTTGERPSLRARRPDLPQDIDEWVALALAIDRDQRFGNVRALWTAFLLTFGLETAKRGRRQSLWASAKNAMGKLAGAVAPATSPARPPSAPRAEATIELGDLDLIAMAPPLRRPEPVEKTLELSDADLLAEPRATPKPPPPAPPRAPRS